MAVTWKKLAQEADVVLKTAYTAKGDLLVASAANTPAVLGIGNANDVLTVTGGTAVWAALGAPASHATTHKNGGSDELLLNELGEPTGDIECNDQEFNGLVLENSVSDTATAHLGKVYFKTGDTGVYVCTVAS
jgi:hypothetical protein